MDKFIKTTRVGETTFELYHRDDRRNKGPVRYSDAERLKRICACVQHLYDNPRDAAGDPNECRGDKCGQYDLCQAVGLAARNL